MSRKDDIEAALHAGRWMILCARESISGAKLRDSTQKRCDACVRSCDKPVLNDGVDWTAESVQSPRPVFKVVSTRCRREVLIGDIMTNSEWVEA